MAMTDIGTGTYTILTQIAADMLGLPPQRIRVELGDTTSRRRRARAVPSARAVPARPCSMRAIRCGQSSRMMDGSRNSALANGRIESAGQSRILTDLVGAGIDAEVKSILAVRSRIIHNNPTARTSPKSESMQTPVRSA